MTIMHVWHEDDINKVYRGVIKKKKNGDYEIDYDMEDSDNEIYTLKKYYLAADVISGDLEFVV